MTTQIIDKIDGVEATITFNVDDDGTLENVRVSISQETLDALAEDPDILDLCEHHITAGSWDYTSLSAPEPIKIRPLKLTCPEADGVLPKPDYEDNPEEWAEHQACEAEYRHDALTDR